MNEFYPFFLVLFAGIFFSTIFRRFHIPWVLALIVGGIVMGEHGFGVFRTNITVDFLGQVGLVFLMFMAGLETKLSGFRQFRRDIFTLSLFNGLVPLAVGFSIGYLFGYGIVASLLLGIIFISSSIAVIIPSLESNGLLELRIGKLVVASTVIEDVTSLILFSVLLQTIQPVTSLPLPLFYVLLVLSLVGLRLALPTIQLMFLPQGGGKDDRFQQEVRTIIAMLAGTVIIFELLGLHSIIAGFFAGLILSESITTEALKEKLRTVSYGIFIPIFFVVVGAKTDIVAMAGSVNSLLLTAIIIFGSVFSKLGSGFFAGRIAGFSSRESALIGASTIPQLSTTLAVVFTGVELDFLRSELVGAMVVLSVSTVFLAPYLVQIFHVKKTILHPKILG